MCSSSRYVKTSVRSLDFNLINWLCAPNTIYQIVLGAQESGLIVKQLLINRWRCSLPFRTSALLSKQFIVFKFNKNKRHFDFLKLVFAHCVIGAQKHLKIVKYN